MLLNKQITKENWSVSTYWRVVEYNHHLIHNEIKLVLWGYTSEVIANEQPNNINDVKVYILQTEKKFTPQEIMETIPHPAIEGQDAVDATYDEDENELTPYISAVPAQEAWEEKRGTGEFTQVWVNEKDYINVEQLVSQIIPFIHANLVAGGDFIWAEIID